MTRQFFRDRGGLDSLLGEMTVHSYKHFHCCCNVVTATAVAGGSARRPSPWVAIWG
jgi:hypothetical protein